MIRLLEILRVMPSNDSKLTEIQWCWRKYPEAQDIIDALDVEEMLNKFSNGSHKVKNSEKKEGIW